MGRKSRTKGVRGEREARDLWLNLGFAETVRSAQRTGRGGMPDLTGRGTDGLHIEVKFQASPSVRGAMRQAMGDAEFDSIPVVLSRATGTGEPWLLTFPAEQLWEFFSRCKQNKREG